MDPYIIYLKLKIFSNIFPQKIYQCEIKFQITNKRQITNNSAT